MTKCHSASLSLSKHVLSACKAVEGGRTFLLRLCQKEGQAFDRLRQAEWEAR